MNLEVRSCHHAPLDAERRAAFDARVAPHLDRLHRAARVVLKCPDLACDAVQSALIVLWERDTEPEDLVGWLVRTVVNHALHLVRHERRLRRREAVVGQDRDESCPLCDPASLLEREHAEHWLREQIRRLPPDLRAVCELRGEDLEYAEIALRLAVPVGTVRSRLHRARAALQATLSESFAE